MASAWQTDGECHFTWNLEKNPVVIKTADKILRKIQNNLAETDFLGIEHLLFKACLQVWFKKASDARMSLDEAKQEIEKRRNGDEYKGYKSVELLNRMWIEKIFLSNSQKLCELHEELKTIQLEEKDLRVVGAIRSAALMRLGPVMFDTNLALFKAAHQAFPSNPNFLFGVALVTGKKMKFMKPYPPIHDCSINPLLKDMMDEEEEYWKKLTDLLKPDHREYHYAKSMRGMNLYRRDGSGDKKKASELLNEAYDDAPELQEVCRNLIRMLRETDLNRCVSILEAAIANQHDRTENHHQLAMCYIEKAKQENRKKWYTSDKEEKSKHQDKAIEWTRKALNELDECLKLDSSHVFAWERKAIQLKLLGESKSLRDCYMNMIQMANELLPTMKLRLYTDFASYQDENESAPEDSSRSDYWQEVMNISTDKSFEKQNGTSGKWETTKQAAFYKEKAYEKLKDHYKEDRLNLGILLFQNFEFDQVIGMLNTVGQTNAKELYYVAKSYLKMGQEKTVGNQVTAAAKNFTRARENVELARKSGLEPQKAREVLADTALAIAHNELQANANDVIQLEDRCVTSYREAVRCGSLVAVLELMKLVEKGLIKITPTSRYIQMLAEIEVCSQSQSDILHGESKPLTFKEGLRSKETDIEPCSQRNRTKIKADIKRILSKEKFFQKARKGLFEMEVELLKERFEGTDGHGLDGREEASPLEGVTDDVIDKAVSCFCDTRPLLDRVMEKFMEKELEIAKVKKNYFPLVLNLKLTLEQTETSFQDKLKIFKVDMRTHHPKLYEYLRKLQPKTNPENTFMKNFCTIVNMEKHSNDEVLAIEPNLVKLARQSTDKVEEICQVFFHTMKETKALKTRVQDLVSAIKQGGGEEVDELFGILMKNEDYVIRMNDTCKFLEMLALINHRRAELSKRYSRFSQDLRKGYLDVEAALLTNGCDERSTEVLKECNKTCLEADKLLNKSLQSEENLDPTFPFLDQCPVGNKQPWEGNVKKQLKSKELPSQKISKKLLDIILQAQPCSNEENYRFIAMRKFISDRSSGIIKHTVSIEKETNSTESYGVLDLTRWCVNHAEKLASEVMACMNQL